MSRYPALYLFVLGLCCCCATPDAVAQTAQQLRRDRLQGSLDVTNQRINEQRVARQTEVMRLESMLGGFENRMTRMERQMLTISRLPGITIAEAEAELQFAELQLKESEYLHSKGEGSEIQVARDRLALVRARGQLQAARAAHAESQIILELDVAFAERKLLEASNEKEQMERMVAKGYTSSDGLRFQILDLNLAQKQLQLAQVRLKAQREMSTELDTEAKLNSPPESE